MGKLLTIKFKSRCAKCRQSIPVGEQAWWERSKVIYHQACYLPSPVTTPQTPPTPRPTVTRAPSTYTTHFASWSDFVDQAENGQSDMRECDRSSRDSPRRDNWTPGTPTFKSAVTLARTGWELELPRVQSFTNDILGDIRPSLDTAFHSLYSVSGAECDISRYLSGEPENMIELVPVQISHAGRVISIHVQLNINWMVDPVELLQRGAAIVALVDILTQLQHSVEIVGEIYHSAFDDSATQSVTVLIKEATSPLDISNLIFAIAHPATHRRLMFSLMEQGDSTYRRLFAVPGGYGSNSVDISSDSSIVLTKADHITNGKQWIMQHLAQFGLIGDNDNE